MAFHDATSKTFEELDGKMAPLVEKLWKGKALPFPILLDTTGKTLKEWNIRAFPTVVLIDPEGKIVKGGGLEALKKALESEAR